MVARIDHAITSGTFSLDGETFDVELRLRDAAGELVVRFAGSLHFGAGDFERLVGVLDPQFVRRLRVDLGPFEFGLGDRELGGAIVELGEELAGLDGGAFFDGDFGEDAGLTRGDFGFDQWAEDDGVDDEIFG